MNIHTADIAGTQYPFEDTEARENIEEVSTKQAEDETTLNALTGVNGTIQSLIQKCCKKSIWNAAEGSVLSFPLSLAPMGSSPGLTFMESEIFVLSATQATSGSAARYIARIKLARGQSSYVVSYDNLVGTPIASCSLGSTTINKVTYLTLNITSALTAGTYSLFSLGCKLNPDA